MDLVPLGAEGDICYAIPNSHAEEEDKMSPLITNIAYQTLEVRDLFKCPVIYHYITPDGILSLIHI